MRSTNFLTRLLTGIKTAQPDNKTDDKKTSTNAGPAWTKAENLEDDSLKGKFLKLQLSCFFDHLFLFLFLKIISSKFMLLKFFSTFNVL